MELTNEFSVAVPIDRAWDVLTDVETIAPCLPGAKLEEIEGDEYRGFVKVKVGPITAQYKGKATFVEKDEAAHRVVIKGDGRDTRGQGNASALITAKLESGGPNTTNVTVSTELTVTGKVAQFGRGVMADVSGKLMDQFADNLSAIVLVPTTATATPAAPPAPAGPAAQSREAQPETSAPAPSETSGPGDTNGSGASTGTIRKLNLPDPEPIDLMDTAGSSVAKRVLPVIGVGALLLILFRLMRRKG